MKLILEIDPTSYDEVSNTISLLKLAKYEINRTNEWKKKDGGAEQSFTGVGATPQSELMKDEIARITKKTLETITNYETGFDTFDSAGQQWNPKIHSRTKSKNKDGTWKIKRGLDSPAIAELSSFEDYSDAAEKIIKKAHIAALNLKETLTEEAAPLPNSQEVFNQSTPIEIPKPPLPVDGGQYDHIDVMGVLSNLLILKKLTRGQIDKLLLAHGVPNVAELEQHSDKFSAIVDEVKKYG